MKIPIDDEDFYGNVLNKIVIEVENDSCTLKELIEQKVIAEVKKRNRFNLNISKNTEKIDCEKEVYIALAEFMKKSFFVIIDNKQYTNLNNVIDLVSERKIKFVKLTQLKSG